MSTNFAEGTDYLKVLAKEFAQTLAKEGNKHLKNFFVLVTPLILNFSESIRCVALSAVAGGSPPGCCGIKSIDRPLSCSTRVSLDSH